MRRLVPLGLVLSLVVLFGVGAALAQDPAKVGPNIYKCIFENDQVRVCEVKFKPGERVAVHSHPQHVVYGISGGKLRFSPATGDPVEIDFKPGQVIWSPADTHSAVNIGTTELRGVIVELKPALDPTAAAILDMERDWAKAMMSGDMATFERIVADDWVLTNPAGHKQTRAEAIADLRSGALKFDSTVASELDVKVHGDTAIVTGRSTDKGSYKGMDISGDYRFTDVFMKRDGKWVAVATHVTRVMPMP